MNKPTIYYDTEGKQLGSDDFLLPITLYKGMKITITKYEGAFEVVDWNYHKGHADENAGLRVILKPLKTR